MPDIIVSTCAIIVCSDPELTVEDVLKRHRATVLDDDCLNTL